MRTLCHILLLLLVVPVLYAQDEPSWAMRLPDLPARPGFYQGLGSAKSSGDADADWQKASGQARSQVLQQIRVVVNNKIVSTIEEKSATELSTVSEAYTSTTDQLATGTLENLLVERWFDEDEEVLYAYASVSRAEVEAKFEEQLQAATGSARVYRDAAAGAIAGGNAYGALGNYLQAIKDVSFAELYLNKTIRGDIRGRNENVPVLPVLQSELCSVLNGLKFQITGGDDQQAERGRALPASLTGRVTVKTDGGEMPFRNAALTASFVPPATGSLSPVSRTDEEGNFSLSATEIKGGDAVNKIRVSVALPGFEALAEKAPDAMRCVADASADFTFRLRTRASLTVAMHIVEYNLAKKRAKSSVQEEIQKKLLSDRYTILEESRVLQRVSEEKLSLAAQSGDFNSVVSGLSSVADVVVVGTVSTQERANPTSGIFFSSGTAVVRAIDTKSGRVLASVSLDNEKEGGGSYEVAGMRLLQKMGRKIGEELKRSIDGTVN